MALTEVVNEINPDEQPLTESQGSTSLLCRSAFSRKIVDRSLVSDASGDLLNLVGLLFLITITPSIILIFMIVEEPDKKVNAIVSIFVKFLLGLAAAWILSFINCKISGYDHDVKEYQIFLSLGFWVAISHSVFVTTMLLDIRILGFIIFLIITFIVAGYLSRNYQEKFTKDESGWITLHYIYLLISYIIMSILL